MTILSGVQSVNGGITTANSLLNQLGLNNWTLSDGIYNGCSFVAFAPTIPFGLGSLYSSANDITATVNQTFGTSIGTINPNGFGHLIDTTLAAVRWEDKLISQIAIKKLPFANRVNTENLGYGGWEFTMTLIFFGPDYQKAIQNFENAMANPPFKNYLQLVHPIRGLIPGITRVTSYTVGSDFAQWKAGTLHITFRSEIGLSYKQTSKGLIKKIAEALSAVLGAITAIQSAIATVTSLLGLDQPNPPPANLAKAKLITKASQSATKALMNNTNYIYKNSNTGVVNSTFSSTPINQSLVPLALQQSTKYTQSQGNYLLTTYQQQCESSIKAIKIQGLGGNSNELINRINTSISLFNDVTTLMLPTITAITYTTPYIMSIREVLIRNNLPINIAPTILSNNPFIPSANYIPQGMQILLI